MSQVLTLFTTPIVFIYMDKIGQALVGPELRQALRSCQCDEDRLIDGVKRSGGCALTWRTARSRARAERFRQMAIGRSISDRLAASFCERYRGHKLRSSYPNYPEVCFLKS